jgi:hypothetical protein
MKATRTHLVIVAAFVPPWLGVAHHANDLGSKVVQKCPVLGNVARPDDPKDSSGFAKAMAESKNLEYL